MKRASLILLILLLYSYSSFACICLPDEWSVERVYHEIEHNDLIFIGNRISYSQEDPARGDYSFRVIEAFKVGIKEGDVISGKAFSNCSASPYIDGLWIVYATKQEGGFIDMEACGLSRSLSEPIVPLPPPNSFDKDLQEKKLVAFPAFLREWHNEYVILQSFKNRRLPTEEEGSGSGKEDTFLVYFAIGLALAALAVSLLKK